MLRAWAHVPRFKGRSFLDIFPDGCLTRSGLWFQQWSADQSRRIQERHEKTQWLGKQMWGLKMLPTCGPWWFHWWWVRIIWRYKIVALSPYNRTLRALMSRHPSWCRTVSTSLSGSKPQLRRPMFGATIDNQASGPTWFILDPNSDDLLQILLAKMRPWSSLTCWTKMPRVKSLSKRLILRQTGRRYSSVTIEMQKTARVASI